MILSPFDPIALPLIGALIPPDPTRGAAMMMHDPDRPNVTAIQALALLPEFDRGVHTFLAGVGAVWPQADIVGMVRSARSITLTGSLSRALDHGLAVHAEDGRTYLVETDPARLAAFLAERATPGARPHAAE